MPARVCLSAVLLLTTLAAGSRASAREIRVKPGQSLRAAVEAARAGDTINVGAGTYDASQIEMPSGIRLVSIDGPGKARLDGQGRGETLRIYGKHDIVIDGFEIFHAGENIVKMEGARNITVRRCKIHDAGQDCVKVTIGSHFITVEDCEIYNPGRHADDGKHEQNVDFMDTERAIVRRCLLYHVAGHGDQIGFFKAGSRGCLFEQNIVLNAGGGPDDSPAFTLGQDSDSEYKHGNYACYDSIVRDNLFVNCRNGAIGFYGCKGGYAYGNVIINSCPPFGFHRAGVGVNPAIDGVFILDNAILNPAGNLDRMFEGRQNVNGRMLHDYNLVWNGGKTPPHDAYEPHGSGERPAPAALLRASPAEGYAALAARFAAIALRGEELASLLPAAARAGDPDRGLPFPPAVVAAAPAAPRPSPPALIPHAVPPPHSDIAGPALADADPPAQPDLAAREAAAPTTTRPRVARSAHAPPRRSVHRRVARRSAIHHVALRSHRVARRAHARRPAPRRSSKARVDQPAGG